MMKKIGMTVTIDGDEIAELSLELGDNGEKAMKDLPKVIRFLADQLAGMLEGDDK